MSRELISDRIDFIQFAIWKTNKRTNGRHCTNCLFTGEVMRFTRARCIDRKINNTQRIVNCGIRFEIKKKKVKYNNEITSLNRLATAPLFRFPLFLCWQNQSFIPQQNSFQFLIVVFISLRRRQSPHFVSECVCVGITITSHFWYPHPPQPNDIICKHTHYPLSVENNSSAYGLFCGCVAAPYTKNYDDDDDVFIIIWVCGCACVLVLLCLSSYKFYNVHCILLLPSLHFPVKPTAGFWSCTNSSIVVHCRYSLCVQPKCKCYAECSGMCRFGVVFERA